MTKNLSDFHFRRISMRRFKRINELAEKILSYRGSNNESYTQFAAQIWEFAWTTLWKGISISSIVTGLWIAEMQLR